MPGFHEHGDDDDGQDVWDIPSEEVLRTAASDLLGRPRPPHSAPSTSQPSSSAHRPTADKPRSAAVSGFVSRMTVSDWQDGTSSAGPSSRPPAATAEGLAVSTAADEQVKFGCPLCAHTFADNDLLNSHIDWCLSREAIRTAQAEAGEKKGSSRGKEREKEKNEVVGAPADGRKEWWKASSGGGAGKRNRKR